MTVCTEPNLSDNLEAILIKFRTNRYAFADDISKAFLRIGLRRTETSLNSFGLKIPLKMTAL